MSLLIVQFKQEPKQRSPAKGRSLRIARRKYTRDCLQYFKAAGFDMESWTFRCFYREGWFWSRSYANQWWHKHEANRQEHKRNRDEHRARCIAGLKRAGKWVSASDHGR